MDFAFNFGGGFYGRGKRDSRSAKKKDEMSRNEGASVAGIDSSMGCQDIRFIKCFSPKAR